MTRKNNIWIIVILAGVLTAALWCLWGCGQPKDIVAKVGRKKITVEQFKEFLTTRFRGATGPEQSPLKQRLDLLEQQIDNELKLLDAYRQGFDKDEEAVQQGEQAAERVALEELYNKEILADHINEEMLREFYDKQGEEVSARHIMIQVSDKNDPMAVEIAKAKIDEIAEQLQAGADFVELATEKSEDQTTAKDGGNLGYFQWGRMVDEFQEAAFALKVGEISEPVLTNYGWHIIMLEDRRPVENRKPYEESKDELKMQVQRMIGEELRDAATEYIEKLKQEQSIVVDTAVVDMVLDKLNDKTIPDGEALFDRFTDEEKQQKIAEYDGGVVTLDSVGKMIASRPSMREFPDRKSLTDVVDGILVPQMLKDEARREGIYDLPRVKKTAQEAREALMVRNVEKAMVDDKIDVTDEGLMAYFEDHQAQYMTDPERTVREIFIYDNEDKANMVARKAKAGEDFLALCKKYNEKKSTQATDGIFGPFSVKRHGDVGKETFKLQNIGDIAGPIKIGRNYSIIQLQEILPARQKTFGEAKNVVRSHMRRDMRKQLMEEWMNDIRSRNKVVVYEDVVAHLYPEDDMPADTPEPIEPETKEGE
jgi:foldase protein PrsA